MGMTQLCRWGTKKAAEAKKACDQGRLTDSPHVRNPCKAKTEQVSTQNQSGPPPACSCWLLALSSCLY